MGRATSGVLGMRFNEGDRLLSIGVVQDDKFVLVATAGATPSGPPPSRTTRCRGAVGRVC